MTSASGPAAVLRKNSFCTPLSEVTVILAVVENSLPPCLETLALALGLSERALATAGSSFIADLKEYIQGIRRNEATVIEVEWSESLTRKQTRKRNAHLAMKTGGFQTSFQPPEPCIT